MSHDVSTGDSQAVQESLEVNRIGGDVRLASGLAEASPVIPNDPVTPSKRLHVVVPEPLMDGPAVDEDQRRPLAFDPKRYRHAIDLDGLHLREQDPRNEQNNCEHDGTCNCWNHVTDS
jgi:hypothetical protein